MTVADLTVAPIGPGDEAMLRSWFDLRRAVLATDRPADPDVSWAHHTGLVRHPWPGSDPYPFLALSGGRPVGWFALWLPTKENLDTAPADLEVHPDHRRRGIGRALLDEAVGLARQASRTRIVAEAVTGSPGAAFATAAGARPALADTQRRLDLATVDDAHLDSLLADAEAHATGYSLLQWVGPTPDRHLDAAAALESRMTTDAPFDDLAWEQEVYDAARIRERDAVSTARRNRTYTTAARHDATGQVVGVTALVVTDGVDDTAGQWQTIVLPEHRGHRLGMLLKVANLRFLRTHEPAVTRVDTWNADSNAPMLRVNIAMGFQPLHSWAEWELPLEPQKPSLRS